MQTKINQPFRCRVFMLFIPDWAGKKCVVMNGEQVFGTIQYPTKESRNNDDVLVQAEVLPEFAQPVSPALMGATATLQVEGFGTVHATVTVCPAAAAESK